MTDSLPAAPSVAATSSKRLLPSTRKRSRGASRDGELKKTLKAVTLELRHLLEGRHDSGGKWKPGDLEQRLAAVGVRRDRASVSVDELKHLAEEDRQVRKVVDAYLKLREEAGVERFNAVAEFVRGEPGATHKLMTRSDPEGCA